ncbi:alcohol dehydrogenase family protein [Halomonas sp. YLGW01]|uniref:alcohol dehydrogenase family protein n=1 Tax=Halomonas sp. YLGW01 TaxID=2773308 RepID=UPI00177DC93B|nr:alcohol dehydrogenase family protein [Halomonas sp. YLGW01]
MKAVVTTGTGDYDKLDYRDVPIPTPGQGEVLIKVLAAGINNTEINTRLGWYSSSVTDATDAVACSEVDAPIEDGGWNAQTPFPFIQGTDCCGVVVQAGPGVAPGLVDQRVLVRSCMRTRGFEHWDNQWMGSDFDGAFAQYVKVPAGEVFAVECDWSDAELGSLPCAYGTSENMLVRAELSPGETVLITGASGGVGSATVQLAKRRGARVIAVADASKHERLREVGADQLFDRGADLLAELGAESVDLVVDNVAGAHFPVMLKLLRRGARLVSSGAIAGPMVSLDMRELYLKDVRLIGTTAWDAEVFPNLVSYIERNEIRPLVARTYALCDIVAAQQEFLTKRHVGKFVLLPWQD